MASAMPLRVRGGVRHVALHPGGGVEHGFGVPGENDVHMRPLSCRKIGPAGSAGAGRALHYYRTASQAL
jgi:hypothetical protein